MVKINQHLKPGTVPKQYELMQVIQIDLADFSAALDDGDLFRRDVHGNFVACQTGGEGLEAFSKGELFLFEPVNEPLEGVEIE